MVTWLAVTRSKPATVMLDSRETRRENSVDQWLRHETPKHLDLLSKLRRQLEQSLTDRPGEPDGDGRPTTIYADVNESGTPTRDWCRVAQRYQTAYFGILAEQREHTKLRIMIQQSSNQVLTDEEYDDEIQQLGKEAVRELSVEDLQREFLRRGMALPVGRLIDTDSDEEH